MDTDSIGEQFVPYLSDGAYYEGFSLFAKLVQTAMEQPDSFSTSGDGYYTSTESSPWYDGLGQGLIGGLVLGGIVVAVMASAMKSVRPKRSASDYVKDGSLRLTCQEDRYLYQTVTKRARPKSNSSSGSHRGSSGRSHGGGGGRF